MNLTLTQHMITMVNQAIALIQHEAAVFIATQKTGYDGLNTDLVTTADIAAQAMYQKYIENHFPNEGIIGEENLHKVGTNHRYFTIDPLDGTKAFGRKQSTGVGTMIAHVDEHGVVDAMCIGDINSGDMYYFGPDVLPTRKRFGVESPLIADTATNRKLTDTYVSIRNHPEDFPGMIQDIVRRNRGGIFKDISVESGSIGIHLTRLWKGEVGMIILKPTFETPWDSTPIVGMNIALDFVHIMLDRVTLEVFSVKKTIAQNIFQANYIEIILHKSYVPEILAWITAWKEGHL